MLGDTLTARAVGAGDVVKAIYIQAYMVTYLIFNSFCLCNFFLPGAQSIMASARLFKDQPVFQCEEQGCATANTTAYYF